MRTVTNQYGNEIDYEAAVQQLKDFIHERGEWMDENIEILPDKYYRHTVLFLTVKQVVYNIRGVYIKSSYRIRRHKHGRR